MTPRPATMAAPDRTLAAIAFIVTAMVCISVNDMLIKLLSGGYPLHQMVFVRSCVGILATMVFLRVEGGWHLLKTDRPMLHALRAGLIVIANMTFFAALAVMPLGAATALFFVAPLFITLLAIPVLGETVGRHRLAAIGIGLAGVVVMMGPGVDWGDIARISLFLPIIAAACYAGMQVLTRKLGVSAAASAMAIYIQGAFIVVSAVFFLVAGDGRFLAFVEHDSLVFLLRPWIWPVTEDLWKFGLLGLMSAMIGYCLSQAYKIGEAATVAPFEYVALPMAVFWGWLIFGEIPGLVMAFGIALIAGAGLYVFARESKRGQPAPEDRPVRRG
jgi:S-adenosylmethionine uptake transporter